jgi:nitrogen fixation NifU-like protein
MRKEYFPYSKTILEHFRKPRNIGKISNPDSIGEAGNTVCGDILRLYIKIRDKKGKKIISDVKVQTFGCIVAIANSSMITTMIKGKTIEDALSLTKNDLVKNLGKPFPPIKIHCSVLAVEALHEAIYNYLLKMKLPIPENLQKEHKRTQYTLETIEKRHKEFIELEERILEKS